VNVHELWNFGLSGVIVNGGAVSWAVGSFMNRRFNRQSSPVSADVAYPFLYTSILFSRTENEAMEVRFIHKAEIFNMIFIPCVEYRMET